MSRTSAFFSLFTAFLVGLVGHAHAERSVHRPWFSAARTESVRPPVENPKSFGRRLARVALRYKGARYRFGKASKKAMDCSGLVTRAYQDMKSKKLPHSSSALYRMGKPIKMSELRAGDLVFFKNTYRKGISHVGVYTGGNRFVHARNRRFGVTVTKLSDPYFQLHYAGARRLL